MLKLAATEANPHLLLKYFLPPMANLLEISG